MSRRSDFYLKRIHFVPKTRKKRKNVKLYKVGIQQIRYFLISGASPPFWLVFLSDSGVDWYTRGGGRTGMGTHREGDAHEWGHTLFSVVGICSATDKVALAFDLVAL